MKPGSAARCVPRGRKGSVKKIEGFVVGVCLLTLLSSVAVGQQVYAATKVPNSSPNTPTTINNLGQVLVNQITPTEVSVSSWNRLGAISALTLGGVDDLGTAMNGNNDVAGTGQETSNGDPQAFLLQAGGATRWLGTLGGPGSWANGLNNSDQVVGVSFTGAGQRHAFLWTEGAGMQDLTPDLTSPFGSVATAINSAGEVVGYYYPEGATDVVAFTWTKAGGLQTFATTGTMAFAVNDAGTVAGQVLTAAGRHAFSWTSAQGLVDLGTLGGAMSTAMGINSNGWVVGSSLASDGSGMLRGFLWTPTGGMQDLTAISNLGGAQPYSIEVNDYGDIAIADGKQVVLLTPKLTGQVLSSANPSQSGSSVKFTTTLTSIAGPPPNGESVQCSVAGEVVSTGTIANGVGQCSVSGLTHGNHAVSIIYPGDVYFEPVRILVMQTVD